MVGLPIFAIVTICSLVIFVSSVNNDDNSLYKSAKMTEMNYLLKFKDKNNVIKEIPVYVNSQLFYTLGLEEVVAFFISA